MEITIIFLVAALVSMIPLSAWLIRLFNRLVRRRNNVDNAWAQVDVQLRRRYDLIPNLVETVRGYAQHERVTLDAVIRARVQALSATGPEETARAEESLAEALRSLTSLSEAYPDLKANGNFLALQEQLATTENKTAYARQYYNDAVLAYNNAVGLFPTVLVAGLLGFRAREFFRAGPDEATGVWVRF